jgi:hypothetical protein
MSVDIRRKRRPGVEKDLCMPVILQLLLACLLECHVASFQHFQSKDFFLLVAFLSQHLNYFVIIT